MSLQVSLIETILRTNYPGKPEDAYPIMATRIKVSEDPDPIDEVDRLFLGGRDGDRTDEEIAIERYFVKLRNPRQQ